MLKIGNLVFEVPFIQAPLNGYTDHAMRRLALDFGVPLTFAGVMLAKSAAHLKTMKHPAFRSHEDEHPVGGQIIGEDPITMATAAKSLQSAGYDIIDLNFACPVPKVLRRGRGGWLLNAPDTVIEIYKRVRDAVTCPVTMKLRTGFDASEKSLDNFYSIVSDVSRLNIDALMIHCRTVMQRYSGAGNWDLLAEVKSRFPNTTILGSGDLFSPKTIVERLNKSKLDGVLIARGAVGNPWIYQELHALLKGEPSPEPPSLKEQGQLIRRHFELICEIFDTEHAVGYFRKFLVQYSKRHPMRKQAQRSLIAATTASELFAAIEQWYGSCA
jgi:tRNA-dihydrouridine synthase B